MKNCKRGHHDYFLAHISEERKREVLGTVDCFKIGTLVCRNCGDTKEIKIDEHQIKAK